LGLPDVWPPNYEIATLDAGRGQDITQMLEINSSLYFFFQDRIMRLVGSSPEDFRLEVVSNHVGCLSPRTLIPWEDGAVFLARTGLFFFNGSGLSRLSQPLFRLFERESFGDKSSSTICGAIANGFYYLSYSESESVSPTDTLNNRVLVCNLRNGRWGVRNVGAFDFSCQYKTNLALTGTYSVNGYGKLFLLSDFPLQDYLHVAPNIQLGTHDFGYPDQVKILERVEVWYDALDEQSVLFTATSDYPKEESPLKASPFTPIAEETHTHTAGTALGATKRPGRWGDEWDGGDTTRVFATMRSWRSTHHFTHMKGKAFRFYMTFDSGGSRALIGTPELRIQKVIFHFNAENHWRGSSAQV
jgi:hypothetical protein